MPQAHAAPRARLAALALALVAACDSGASRPDGPATELNLLARRPDAVFDQPGELRPRKDEGTRTLSWGRAEAGGWDKRIFELEDGTPYMRNNQPAAQLVLSATTPAARELTLRAWCVEPAGDAPAGLEVVLNGFSVATLELGAEPGEHRVPTDAELWGLGENLLELRPVRAGRGAGRTWDVVAVASLSYGAIRELTLDPDERRLVLAAGTGVRYLVDPAGQGWLSLAVHAARPGRLRVRFGALDPLDGRREHDGFPAPELAVGTRPLEHALPVPDVGERIAAVELVWESDAAAELVFDRLVVEDRPALPRPPIVFVSIDTFSARHLSVYGYDRHNTPALEALAADGVVFEHCIANAPWTMPSYLSVLTGLYPRSHVAELDHAPGVRLDNWDYWQIAENRWTIAEALRARGYETAGLGDTHWLSPKFRVDQGFDKYDISAAFLPISEPTGGIVYQLTEILGPWFATRKTDLPPFLFLHALDAHGPYLPEEPFRDRFVDDLPEDLRPTLAGSSYQTYGAIPVWMARTSVPDPEPIPRVLDLEPIIERYDESILKVDHYLGKLFELLRHHDLYDDAVIVVTGDHGESFDHGFYSHGGLWEDVIHVPLLIKLPGNEHGGRRVAQSVQLVDVYPTLFELGGAGTPPGFLHGRSLLPLMRGETLPPRPVFCEGGHVEQYTIIDAGWKLIEVFPGRESGDVSLLTHPRVPRAWLQENFPELVDEPLTDALKERLRARPGYDEKVAELRALIPGPYYRLYDLRADPAEANDLAAERQDEVARLKRLLDEHKRLGRDARKHADWSSFRPRFDAAQLEALAELGYADAPDD